MGLHGSFVTKSSNMTSTKRIVARLDIKGPKLIKGVRLEGLRIIGEPATYAKSYYEQGIDEIIYMDIVASLYGRNNLIDIVRKTADEVFVPLTVGGGIRSINDVLELLNAGADKAAINTAAIHKPDLLREIADTVGSQCVVLSIEAKKIGSSSWEAYTNNGRERTGQDVVKWAVRAAEIGIGEILLTSVDGEGTRKGFDIDLIKRVSSAVDVPIIASGGLGTPLHLVEAMSAGADAVAAADALHFSRYSVEELRNAAELQGITVRAAAPQHLALGRSSNPES